MIERARPEHTPFIVRRLAPFKRVKEGVVEHLIDSPNNVIYVQPEKEIVCRISHQPKNRTNHVDWLLPSTELDIDLYFTMCEALVEVSRRWPEDNVYKTWARFKDQFGCRAVDPRKNAAKRATLAFHTLFPTSSHYKWRWWDNSWIIWGQQGEIVQDIMAFREKMNKPREVTGEPTATLI
jgi:hypothetical protein